MTNPINTLIFGIEPGAVLQLRLLSPLSRLKQEGLLEYKFINYTEIGSFKYKDLESYDLIIFQRVYHPEMLELLSAAKRRGKRTIYEIDDNLLEIPSQHPMSDQFTPDANRQCIIEFLKQVDHVTVSTEPLLHDFSWYNSKITLLPNYLDEKIFPEIEARPPSEGPVRIGYAAGWTHEDDFRQVLPAVKRLRSEYGDSIQFVFFIYIPEELKGDPDVEHLGGAGYVDGYAQLLATAQLDIGLAPLGFNRFNECKSDVKFLEYGSCRIAGVYSVIMAYAQTVKDGETGILAGTEDTDLWYEKIKLLIDKSVEREKIQQQAYDYVMGERTLGSNSYRWYDLYCEVLAESRVTRASKKRPLVSIVILTYNALEFTKRCIDSIRQHTNYPHEVIFVDNGSTDGTKEYLRRQVKEESKYHLIENVYNLGFSAGNNQGAKAAKGQYLLLLNNDVLVADGWLESLVDVIERDEYIGMVGPISNQVSGRQMLRDTAYDEENDYYSFADAIRTTNLGSVTPRRRIAGFAVLIRKALYDDLGGLDEGFIAGNYEDDDLCLRVRQRGYAIMVDESTFVHHFGSRTFIDNQIDYTASLRTNERIFRDKWPDIDTDWLLERDEPLVDALKRKSEAATQLVNRGDLDAGRTLYKEILQENPIMAEAIYGLGLIAHLEGDLGEARNLYQRAVSLNKEWKPVQHSLALLDMAEGKLQAAQLRLAKIVNQDPNDLESRRLLGQSFLEAEHFDEGIGILMGILKDNPNDWQTHFLLAILYAEVDRHEDVKRHLSAVLAANPDHAEAREMLQSMTREK